MDDTRQATKGEPEVQSRHPGGNPQVPETCCNETPRAQSRDDGAQRRSIAIGVPGYSTLLALVMSVSSDKATPGAFGTMLPWKSTLPIFCTRCCCKVYNSLADLALVATELAETAERHGNFHLDVVPRQHARPRGQVQSVTKVEQPMTEVDKKHPSEQAKAAGRYCD